jgi:translation elongation factor EF-G
MPFVRYLPSPLDVPPVTGTEPDDEEKVLERKASVDEPFAALGFQDCYGPFRRSFGLHAGLLWYFGSWFLRKEHAFR